MVYKINTKKNKKKTQTLSLNTNIFYTRICADHLFQSNFYLNFNLLNISRNYRGFVFCFFFAPKIQKKNYKVTFCVSFNCTYM